MEQLTLSQAANNYTDTWQHFTEGSMRASFKAGAEWQKQQDKNLAAQLLGMEAFISDLEMRKKFSYIMSELLQD